MRTWILSQELERSVPHQRKPPVHTQNLVWVARLSQSPCFRWPELWPRQPDSKRTNCFQSQRSRVKEVVFCDKNWHLQTLPWVGVAPPSLPLLVLTQQQMKEPQSPPKREWVMRMDNPAQAMSLMDIDCHVRGHGDPGTEKTHSSPFHLRSVSPTKKTERDTQS